MSTNGSPSNLLTSALDYVSSGYLVFRLAPGTKEPIKGSRGFKDATLDADVIREWWSEMPDANIGIATGPASGIFVLDIDVKSADGFGSLKALEARHSPLPETHTVETPSGGRHYFFQYDALIRNSAGKLGAGIDVRGDGGYVVAAPSIVEGRPYTIINNISPAAPRDWLVRLLCSGADAQTKCCIPASLQPCIPASLHNTSGGILENIRAGKAATMAFETKYPQLKQLYEKLIEPRFHAMAGTRNQFIVKAVTFLYRTVAPRVALGLVQYFYQSNRTMFKSSLEKHMKEATAMLESVSKTYLDDLGPVERQIYQKLSERERDVFRICRDLALSPPEPGHQPFTFYMSFGHLGDRIGIEATQAQRIMRQFESYGLIKTLKKGTRRAPGVRAKAGEYQWLPRDSETEFRASCALG